MLLTWDLAVADADTLVLSRKLGDRWRVIDRFPAQPTGNYTDELLWQDTSYSYRLQVLANGKTIASRTATSRTLVQEGAFPRFYGPHSFWNQPIPAGAASDPRSNEMIRYSFVTFAEEHVDRNGEYFPDANFGATDAWGVPIAYADPVHSKVYDIACTRYGCDTDVSFRIPRYAAVTSGSDHRISVIESTTGRELDMWAASYDPARDRWTAGSRYITTSGAAGSGSLCRPGTHCNAAVAAGWAALGGVVRPEEVAQGHIDHALALTTPVTRADYIACPATHEDGNTRWDPERGMYPVPIGARVQLDPDFEVPPSWPDWKREITEALQVYGGYVTDTGGSVAVRGESPSVARGYHAWSLAGLPEGADRGLDDLPWHRMRVLDLARNRGNGLCR